MQNDNKAEGIISESESICRLESGAINLKRRKRYEIIHFFTLLIHLRFGKHISFPHLHASLAPKFVFCFMTSGIIFQAMMRHFHSFIFLYFV